MLRLTELSEAATAKALADHLLVHAIEADVRGSNPWEVWVRDHDQIEAARDLLARWSEAGPNEADRRSASRIRQGRRHDREAAEQSFFDARRRWYSPATPGVGPITAALVAAAVLVWFASNHGDPSTITMQNLSIEPWDSDQLLGRVREGEAWRLLTPMLIHFTPSHIVFNLLWLWTLGRQIEHNHGSPTMLALVVLAEVPGSLGQYWLTGPTFGGMSGVVYGAFGFVWMNARYSRRLRYSVSDQSTVLMMLWFVAGGTGWTGPIANAGHAGGLLAGLLLGLPPYVRHLRAHARAPVFVGDDWASVNVRGLRRVVRRFVTPYVPLWLAVLAAVVFFAN